MSYHIPDPFSLTDFIDDKDWDGFVNKAHQLSGNDKEYALNDLLNMLHNARNDDLELSDALLEENLTDSMRNIIKHMHYLRDNQLIKARDIDFTNVIGDCRMSVPLLMKTLENTLHDFNLHNSVDKNGLYLLNATVLCIEAEHMLKDLFDLGCDIHKLNGVHGKSIHFIDVSAGNAMAVFNVLLEQGANPLEEIRYQPYPQGYVLEEFKTTPYFNSLKEYIEYNYVDAVDEEDWPDGYDERMMDDLLEAITRLDANQHAQNAVVSGVVTRMRGRASL